MRPTKSLSLFLQQVGRALRPKDDGGQAILLDHVGNVREHGLPCARRGWTLEGRPEPAQTVRTCDSCFKVMSEGEWRARRQARACMVPAIVNAAECPMLEEAKAGSGRERKLEVMDDVELVRFKDLDPAPEWAEGINIQAAEGLEYSRLCQLARSSRERLEYVRRVRGYKPGWVYHQLEMSKRGTSRKYA